MGYTEEIFEKAQEIIASRRTEAENALESRMNTLAVLEPEYMECRRHLIENTEKLITSLDKPRDEVDAFVTEIKNDSIKTRERIYALLRKHNLSPDYLDIRYFCDKCRDSGSVGTRLCDCMTQVLKDLTVEEEAKKSPLKFCRFEDFKLEYYPDSPVVNGKTPRDKMTMIYSFCREYAAAFDTDCPNVCMYGETGLGKTHLSLAIAAEVMGKGYSVIYNSAQNIINKLNKIQFGASDDRTFEPLLMECDLLVIDDLGAEFQTSFTKSAVYNIINTRMNAGLPTIISTNVDISEFAELYGKRVASRILGEFRLLKFTGADIRQIKKQEA